MKPFEVIASLEATASKLEKDRILKSVFDDHCNNTVFVNGCRMALDPFNTFGIKKVPVATEDGFGLDPFHFFDVCMDLEDRSLTGNAAIEAVDQLMNEATAEEWNGFYRRVLIKDLRCGVSDKTWNKAAPHEYKVDVFSCQLATDANKVKNALTGEKLIEVKLDGVRVLSIVHPDGSVEMYSRNGKSLTNFPVIEDQLSSLSSSQSMVFDGEVMSSSFQDLMKQVYRKSDVQTDDAVLYLFDIIPLDEFKKGLSKTSQYARSELLRRKFIDTELENVRAVAWELVDLDTQEGVDTLRRLNKQAIEGGYEGLMIKDGKSKYETKRSKNWLKIKPVIEVTLTVIGVEEGTGKNENKLGALVCEGVDDGTFISVNVGTGISDEQRESWWDNRSVLLGQLVEIQADTITQNQDGTYSLRFPRFKTFRGFEVNEKL